MRTQFLAFCDPGWARLERSKERPGSLEEGKEKGDQQTRMLGWT